MFEIIKIFCDYVLSVIILLVTSPLLLVISLLIFITGGWPVIYTQKRTGKHGKQFNIFKFRSFRHTTEEGINLVSDKEDSRITRIGRIMRKYRIDEMPNFINVLKGEMSIVGPRPEQQYFIDRIIPKNPRYPELLNVKPGITSWGEVKYGYASNLEQMLERLDFDLYYIDNRSLFFDVRILFSTIGIIIRGRGI